ncbi:recombinase family protein [Pseudogracilibacillus auburnensis]|uniref:recombinase family protein n=1 Tax=Pseudogracilibacillus auburnensis TaxID=1494959 RepID=UPI001A963FDF|nr:recombinase family protein [Pseudogracilibacillus auburnensis]MBO1003754.1 recombinase family protein [Pseudogracilibacillus auburnensis]
MSKLAEYNIKSIINYLRKSRQDIVKERRTGEDTLIPQKKLMDRVLTEYGIPYDQEFEIGSGDKITTRPVFQQIIKDLENGKYDAIAVREISRMGRGSYTDMGTIYDLLVDKRIFVITPWRIFDPANPDDLRQIRFDLFMSREEFESTRQKLNGGRYNSALEGNWVSGPPPFGFKYNTVTKKLQINQDEAKVVSTIFDLYANGIVLQNGKRKLVQFRALATYLKRIGIKSVTGKDDWAPNYLKTFLSHDRYIGTYRYNEYRETADGKRVKNPESEHIVIENNHPAIIDIETWEKVQGRINNRATTNTKLDFEPSRLAGLCVCKKCGRRFIRRGGMQKYKKQDGSISLYEKFMLFCGTTGCTYVKYGAIEEDILETLKYLRDLDPGTLKKRLNHMVIKKKQFQNKDDIVNQIKSKREELYRRMDFIYEKYESGIYTDEMFLERKGQIDKEIEELKKINITEPEKEEVIDTELVRNNIDSILTSYEKSTSDSDKNSLLHSVFSHINIEVLKKGRGQIPAVHRIEPFLKSAVLSR